VDLNDAGTIGLANEVRKRCEGIPRRWPVKDASQKVAEKYIDRDWADTTSCAGAGLSYVRHIESRNTALSGGTKK